MTQSKINLEWETLLENQKNLINNEYTNNNGDNEFSNVAFPMVKNFFAKTIAYDLIFASEEEINGVKQRIDAGNREGSIDSIIKDKEFKKKKYEDDEEYQELMKKGTEPMSSPSSQLFYLDFKYETSSSSSSSKSINKNE